MVQATSTEAATNAADPEFRAEPPGGATFWHDSPNGRECPHRFCKKHGRPQRSLRLLAEGATKPNDRHSVGEIEPECHPKCQSGAWFQRHEYARPARLICYGACAIANTDHDARPYKLADDAYPNLVVRLAG